ncbi:thrombospondin type 3 repeat-containing protein [bacterium]|nr:thrombospondin type 3 repeat-containing protein [bacterium]
MNKKMNIFFAVLMIAATFLVSSCGGDAERGIVFPEGTDENGDVIVVPPDTDLDDDGVLDTLDEFPADPSESTDTDNDGVGDNSDNCPTVNSNNLNDRDDDGVGDICDNCPDNDNADQVDTDEDGIGDACEV